MVNTVCYATVYVSDLDRAVEFYESKLGMPVRFRDEEHGYVSFKTAGTSFALARVGPDQAEAQTLVGRHTGLGLGVADIHAAYDALNARGVEFVQPPEKQPWGGTIAIIADPDGNTLFLDRLDPHE